MKKLLFILLILPFVTKGQPVSPSGLPNPNAPTAYYKIGTVTTDSSVQLKTRAANYRPLTGYTAIRYSGDTLYYWKTGASAWVALTVGGVTTTPTLQNVLNFGNTQNRNDSIRSAGFNFNFDNTPVFTVKQYKDAGVVFSNDRILTDGGARLLMQDTLGVNFLSISKTSLNYDPWLFYKLTSELFTGASMFSYGDKVIYGINHEIALNFATGNRIKIPIDSLVIGSPNLLTNQVSIEGSTYMQGDLFLNQNGGRIRKQGVATTNTGPVSGCTGCWVMNNDQIETQRWDSAKVGIMMHGSNIFHELEIGADTTNIKGQLMLPGVSFFTAAFGLGVDSSGNVFKTTGLPFLGFLDIFGNIGQSNNGHGDSLVSPRIQSSLVAYIRQYYNDTDKVANDPVGPANTGSMFPSFGIAYYEKTKTRIALVPNWRDGSSLVLADPDGSWNTSDTLFSHFITQVQHAIAYYTALGYTVRYRGTTWNQGEQDASDINLGFETAAQYRDSLVQLRRRIGVALGDTTLPLWVVRLGERAVAPAAQYYGSVRQAQEDASTLDTNIVIVYRGAVDFPARNFIQAGGNHQHWAQSGLNEAGTFSAQRIADYQYYQPIYYQTTKVGIGVREPQGTLDLTGVRADTMPQAIFNPQTGLSTIHYSGAIQNYAGDLYFTVPTFGDRKILFPR